MADFDFKQDDRYYIGEQNKQSYSQLKFNDINKDEKNEKIKPSNNLEKWTNILKNFDEFMKNFPNKLKSLTRKGIPDCYRGYIWTYFGEVQKYLSIPINQGLYEKILMKEDNDPKFQELIQTILRDIDRTYPKHSFFKDKYGIGQRSLYNVLTSFAKYHPEIGYVQGMGFIAALFLTYMNEESAFWLLHSLMNKYNMKGFYLPDMPDLPKTFYKLLSLKKKHLRKVYDHMCQNKDIPVLMPSMYAMQWFMSLFAINFKFEMLPRIFDIFLLEGQKIIYRIGFAFLKINEDKIRKAQLFEEIMDIFKTGYDSIDIDELFYIAFNTDFSFKKILNESEKTFESLILNNIQDELIEICK